MEFEQILKLIDRVSDSKLSSFEYENGGIKLSMECGETQFPTAAGGTMTQPALRPVPALSVGQDQSGEKEPENLTGNVVQCPLVGIFYAAPQEDAPPFVSVGDTVKKGQVLAIVEAMKLMNDIESDFDGKVAEIYGKNGEPVEYGQPLFRIE